MANNFVEAFKCECGHFMPKYMGGGLFPLQPTFTFYDCCPRCGRTKNKIKLVVGKWKYKRITRGWWIFKSVNYKRDYFTEQVNGD